MLSTFVYQTEQEVIKILQITDPHLFKEADSELLGINTCDSFSQVVQEVRNSCFDYDLVLATGDLVQDNSDEGYQRFYDMVQPLQRNVFWIPGNHDFQPKMFEILNKGTVKAVKHLLIGDYWQILLLDSQVFGAPHGQLGQYQIDWLRAKLKDYPERYSLVVLHHHILPTNSAWLDQHNLRNAHDLFYTISPFRNVKAILYGHIHQQVDSDWNGYQVMATPSTCIQFKPDNNHFMLDDLQPGWRELELHANGTITTQVKRIQQKVFLPNMREDGY
ncbi:3',5'-cyclic-AMP phosphodiesterase [Rodentibacter caecimuris]|uniref:3',5'-cyclic adenosine monophosphate phosphodiesterase CpdA n=1 Tax=Rodentibacter caecimuris TaxID=1796644 RepID=A0ABX3KVR5_9PAST|nr:3',5'-cyclic-AMP phosphodiesterase [Rodentibacter heylii]